jgi:hypothetical protein
MDILLTWIYRLVGALALMTVGALLMRVRMHRREGQAVASERRRGDLLIAENRRRHEHWFKVATKELLRAQAVVARMVEANTRLTTENARLRERLGRTAWALDAWSANTKRGQA